MHQNDLLSQEDDLEVLAAEAAKLIEDYSSVLQRSNMK